MLELSSRGGRYYYSILRHPVARVLKSQNVFAYLQAIPEGGRVLDYGSGDQPYAPALMTHFEEYVSGDHPEANKKHGKRPDVYIEDNCIAMDDASVDCVLLTEVLEHVYKPAEALAEINRVLKSGGYVLGSVPFAMGEHELPYDFFRYTSEGLRKLAMDAGFEVVELDRVGDLVGVSASASAKTGQLFVKAIYKIRLGPIARLIGLFNRVPELIYYAALRTPLSPSKVSYFRTFPLGFTFLLKKPGDSS